MESPAPPSDATAESAASFSWVLDGFTGPLKRPRVSLLYQLGLAVVSLAMLLLPALYLALIAAAGYGVYYYATHFYHPLMHTGFRHSPRGFLCRLFLYLTPLFCGTVVGFFMIKPLFAGRGPRAQPYALNPEAEPLLYAFIAKVCALVGAPFPRRIDLDCQLNASAGFRRGWRSLFSDDLVLTIGLPLVAGLDLRQFAGILAHEFGHFTQGLGMRLYYLIMRINSWFARVVYERDAWDVALAEWAAETESGYAALAVSAARLGVWVSRRILYVLMLVGHALSSFLSRQMEYHADLFEIRLVGSDGFESAARRLPLLAEMLRRTYQDLRRGLLRREPLPDSLPVYLVNRFEDAPDELKAKVAQHLGAERTRLFDTHPCASDRIAAAQHAAAAGVFQVREPATCLFANFEAPARFVTLFHYQDDLNLAVTAEHLAPVEAHAHAAAREAEARGLALPRYFCDALPVLRPLDLTRAQVQPPLNAPEALAFATQVPLQLAAVQPQITEACAGFVAAEQQLERARQALFLARAGFAVQLAEFGLGAGGAADILGRIETLQQQRQGRVQQFREVRAVLHRRLANALGLLWLPRVTDVVGDWQATQEQADRLLEALAVLAGLWPTVEQLRAETQGLTAVLAKRREGAQAPRLDAVIAESGARARDLIDQLQQATLSCAYPFRHAAGRISVHHFSSSGAYDPADPSAVEHEAATRVDRLVRLHDELAGGLACIAEAAEAAAKVTT